MDRHNSYLAWQRMDNYLASFLYENPHIDSKIKTKIKHFQIQYLLKVSNICPEDADRFSQNLSCWSSPYRGDYHRFNHLNPLLNAIEKAVRKESFTVHLIQDRKRFETFLKTTSCCFDSVEGQDVFLESENQPGPIREWIVERGLTPTLQQAAQAAVRFSLSQENPSFEFPPQNPPETSFLSFRNSSVFLSFEQFGKKVFSASVLAALFNGFKSFDLDQGFERFGIHPLLRDSYGRILCFLEEAMRIDLSIYANWPKFESYLDLAHEEIVLWLMIAEPYSDKDLKIAIANTIAPPVFLKTVSTGMAAFSEILQVVLDPEKKILMYDGCYFENRAALLKMHPSKNVCLVRYPDYEASLQANLNSLRTQDQTIDLLFVNFHENILKGRHRSCENKVCRIVEQIFQSGRNSPSFTVVIDTTIGFLDSKEMRDLLERFKRELDSRKLHIAILWSHQKFDLLGFDKVSAGSYALYSADPSFIERFKTIGPSDIDFVSRQCLAHYFTAAASKLEERRARIFSNALYVNSRIAEELKFRGSEQPIFAVAKEDPQNFSVDVQCSQDVEILICEEFAKMGIPLMARSSFGFNLTTVASTRFNTLRFSIGIEEPKFLDQFIDAFNEIFKRLELQYR